MTTIDDLAGAIVDVAAKVGPSVVQVGGGWRGGSGVVIAPGAVLTNAHNIRGGEVNVTFADGRRAAGEPTGIDLDGDLAVVAVDTGSAPALGWAEQPAGLGDPVFAVTVTGDGPRVTVGRVSSTARAFRGPRGRRIAGSLEHTAPLAPGSSGSPIVDADGQLLGLNTNRLGHGFYLALPADASLHDRVATLQRGESAERPRLGIGIAPSWVAQRMRHAVGLPDREGVLVRDVEPDSPAARAGIAEGDLIVEAGGRAIRDPDDVYDALGDADAGGTLQIKVVRGAEERAVEVSFSDRSPRPETGPVH